MCTMPVTNHATTGLGACHGSQKTKVPRHLSHQQRLAGRSRHLSHQQRWATRSQRLSHQQQRVTRSQTPQPSATVLEPTHRSSAAYMYACHFDASQYIRQCHMCMSLAQVSPLSCCKCCHRYICTRKGGEGPMRLLPTADKCRYSPQPLPTSLRKH